jgi:hypothetical protein
MKAVGLWRIVLRSFLFVTKCSIGFLDLLEFGLVAAFTVRMMLSRLTYDRLV